MSNSFFQHIFIEVLCCRSPLDAPETYKHWSSSGTAVTSIHHLDFSTNIQQIVWCGIWINIKGSVHATWRTINANIKTHWAPLQWFLLLCWWYQSRMTVRILPVQGELGHYLNLLQPPSPLFFISLFRMVAYSASASCSSNPSSSTTGKLFMTSDGQNFLGFWKICQYHFSANAVCQHKQMESNATLLYCSCDKTEK